MANNFVAMASRQRSLGAKSGFAEKPLHQAAYSRPLGYLAGDTPGGTTTVDGAPVSCLVRVFLRSPLDASIRYDKLVATVQSAAPGTWRVDNLDVNRRYDVIASYLGFNDVIASNGQPKGYGESRVISVPGIPPCFIGSPTVSLDPATNLSTWDAASSGWGVVISNNGRTGKSIGGSMVATWKYRNPATAGSYQFEILVGPRVASGTQYFAMVGLSNILADRYGPPGVDANGYGYYLYDGNYYTNGSGSAMGPQSTEGDYIGVVLNTGGQLRFYKNGVLIGTRTVPTTRPLRPSWGGGRDTNKVEEHTCTLNVGQAAFAYPIAGATPWQ